MKKKLKKIIQVGHFLEEMVSTHYENHGHNLRVRVSRVDSAQFPQLLQRSQFWFCFFFFTSMSPNYCCIVDKFLQNMAITSF